MRQFHRGTQLRIGPVLKLKRTFRAEAYGSDYGVRAQLWFVVAMPGHAVPLIAIIVEQNAVEGNAIRQAMEPD